MAETRLNENEIPSTTVVTAGYGAVLEYLLASIVGRRVQIPHRLGIRCRLLLHQKLLHGVRRHG